MIRDRQQKSTLADAHRVFISSTTQDLIAYQQTGLIILERVEPLATKMDQFETLGSRNMVEVSTDMVVQSTLYLGIAD